MIFFLNWVFSFWLLANLKKAPGLKVELFFSDQSLLETVC